MKLFVESDLFRSMNVGGLQSACRSIYVLREEWLCISTSRGAVSFSYDRLLCCSVLAGSTKRTAGFAMDEGLASPTDVLPVYYGERVPWCMLAWAVYQFYLLPLFFFHFTIRTSFPPSAVSVVFFFYCHAPILDKAMYLHIAEPSHTLFLSLSLRGAGGGHWQSGSWFAVCARHGHQQAPGYGAAPACSARGGRAAAARELWGRGPWEAMGSKKENTNDYSTFEETTISLIC